MNSCNCSAKPPPAIKVVLMGSDSYVNAVLRCYVEQFSSKPPDWQNYLRFYVVPFGSGPNALARYLASLDRYYNVNFVSDSWRESIALSDRYFSLSLFHLFVLFYFVLFCFILLLLRFQDSQDDGIGH